MQTGARKTAGGGARACSHSKSRSRSHHVGVVLARIFAKQQGYLKQKSLRHLDLENLGTLSVQRPKLSVAQPHRRQIRVGTASAGH
jgi:hypothetical protein